jgi:hypothetical protein
LSQPEQADVASLVSAFIEANRSVGFDARSEASRVLKSAAGFSGWRYRITRELTRDWVDCSTLVSQAHWNGAGIGVPFVAETQRRAYSALAIAPEERTPSDVLIAYPTKAMAPDGRHNHVVMYLGRHPQLGEWVIEAAVSADGVQVRPLKETDSDGGVRRFLPFPKSFAFPATDVALRLAQSVPKLGRLGARLTSGLVVPRRHRGVDIYAREEFSVRAPLDGSIVRETFRGQSRLGALHVISPNRTLAVSMYGIEWTHLGSDVVEVGDVLGVCRRHPASLCNSIPVLRGYPKLHLEMWSKQRLPFSYERGLAPPPWMDDVAPTPRPFNPIYAIKLGLIGTPIEKDDIDVLLTMPWSPKQA